MGLNKSRYTAGERDRPIPGHGGTYRMPDDRGWYALGTGPRPHYWPTADELRRHGITAPTEETDKGEAKQLSLF